MGRGGDMTHNQHINELTPSEAERLSVLLEEMGEAIQIIGKIQRHGYDSKHPHGGPLNRELLEMELGHIRHAVGLLCDNKDILIQHIYLYAKEKSKEIHKWLHHDYRREHEEEE